ncbi:tyrosine-type recombinase/integrase [Methanochimaera problematica]|uniref:tyrosine-type recombinase/integrase n=1 Tax=Methanochimaera problematica TaxID=2609417 RepID=UPI002938E900|nr:tyrosine-type recombinase/integrase [Methanoplanus sp. FWC-SCC4]
MIETFLAEKSNELHISTQRKIKIARSLFLWRDYIGEFRDSTYADLSLAIDEMKSRKTEKGTSYKQNTLRDHIGFIKRFYLWLEEEEIVDIPEKKLRRINPPGKDKMTKTVNDILKHREVMAIINACKNSRDRALISVMYEGAFRSGEIGELTWGDVEFRDTGLVVNTKFKTGIARRILLANSTNYLASWKDDYPYEITPEMPVFLTFVNNSPKEKPGERDPERPVHKSLTYAGLRKQIKILVERAEIKHNVTTHTFRHSRITHLVQAGYPESYIKKMCWGTITTDQLATYLHLDDKYMDDTFYHYEGIKPPERKDEVLLEAIQCPRCYAVNGFSTKFCRKCGLALNDKTALEMEEVMSFIQQAITAKARENPEELGRIIQQFSSA